MIRPFVWPGHKPPATLPTFPPRPTPNNPPMIRPTAPQRALAHLATGSLPPLRVMDLMTFTTGTAASLALGMLIGWGIVP